MQWLKVEQTLPPDSQEVLLLIQGYGFRHQDPLEQRQTKWIFLGSFNRRYGWHVPYAPGNTYAVIAWMPKPNDLPEEKDAKDSKVNGK